MISFTNSPPSPVSEADLDESTRSHPFLDEISRRLEGEFAGVHSRELVDRCVRRAFGDFRDARVVAYLPVLVYRRSRDELVRQRLETPAGGASV